MGRPNIWTEDKAIKEAIKYKTRRGLKTQSRGAYDWFQKSNRLYALDRILPKRGWTEESALKEAWKYKTRADFDRGSRSAYNWLQKNKKLHLLKKIFPEKITESFLKKHLFKKVV